ncbi:MAG TPA: ATP phosphoribosyltransferase [Terriglobia bacterium]|nr:ATP phosphoribosyltransferase [Terriglobia bacterium]
MLVIALAKGRLLEKSLELLASADIRFSEDVVTSRKLIFDAQDGKHRIVLVKPADVPTYVEYGAADAGIAGLDVVLESRSDLVQPLALHFGRCKLAVAAPAGVSLSASENPTVRVATKYPHLTMEYFNARGIPVEMIYLAGSIELAPLLGLADRIVDLVESGRTLKENGLEIVEVILESSARLVVNRASYQTKRAEVLKFVGVLNQVSSCASST